MGGFVLSGCRSVEISRIWPGCLRALPPPEAGLDRGQDVRSVSTSTQTLGDENQSNADSSNWPTRRRGKIHGSQVCHLLPESICVMTMLCWILVQNTGVCTTTAA